MAWYVLRVCPGKEEYVSDKLIANGMLAMNPRTITKKYGSDGILKREVKTLFPGYLFVCVSYNPQVYYDIKSNPYVTNWLEAPEPLPLSKAEAALIKLLNNKGFPLEQSIVNFSANGGKYQVESGILARLAPRFEAHVSKKSQKAFFDIVLCGHTFELCLPICS